MPLREDFWLDPPLPPMFIVDSIPEEDIQKLRQELERMSSDHKFIPVLSSEVDIGNGWEMTV
jgi:hypothetical protein